MRSSGRRHPQSRAARLRLNLEHQQRESCWTSVAKDGGSHQLATAAPLSNYSISLLSIACAADFEKGFIRAETVAYDDYVSAGGMGAAKVGGRAAGVWFGFSVFAMRGQAAWLQRIAWSCRTAIPTQHTPPRRPPQLVLTRCPHCCLPALQEKGLLRLEGKEYVVKEGDIMLFRFNV